MSLHTRTLSGPITREEWRRIVVRHNQYRVKTGWQRLTERYVVKQGYAKLVFELPAGRRKVPIVRTVPVLDLSDGGIAVKSHRTIPEKTGVGIELNLDGTPLILVGKVARSTLIVGGYQVGIELTFEGDLPAPT